MPVRIRRPEPISRRVDQQVDHRPDKPGIVVRVHARRPDVSADSKTWLAAVLHTAPGRFDSASADHCSCGVVECAGIPRLPLTQELAGSTPFDAARVCAAIEGAGILRHPFKVECAGSIPVGGTRVLGRSVAWRTRSVRDREIVGSNPTAPTSLLHDGT